jgi:hypothetical protein
MARTPASNPNNRGMPVLQKWKRLTIGGKNTFVTSIIVTLTGILALTFQYHFSQKQTNLDSAVATFQVNVQKTADYQYLQQYAIQQTQAAQVLPSVQVVTPSRHIFHVERITPEKTPYGYVLIGEGWLDVILANNGGGRAGIVSVDWSCDVSHGVNPQITGIDVGGMTNELPASIDAQTPVKIQLRLEATVPYPGDPSGKSDYQLGEYWRNRLQSEPTQIVIRFSNFDPIFIKLDGIQLAMSDVAFEPDPAPGDQ